MKISDLNYNECAWIKDRSWISRAEYLKATQSYIVFGEGDINDFDVYYRGDLGHMFASGNEDRITPRDFLEGREYIPLHLNQELASIGCLRSDRRSGLIFNEQDEPIAVVEDVWNLFYLGYTLDLETYRMSLRLEYYKRIIDNIEEEIFVTDEYGFIQFMNPHAEKVCGVKISDVIGCHVTDMEKRGLISSSITQSVLERQTSSTKVMRLHTGHTVIASGMPIYDDDGKLINVLVSSKDVAEFRDLLDRLDDVTSNLEMRTKEVEELRRQVITQDNYVMQSAPMKEVEKTIWKVAPTDASVLIDGESGTGKEVIAELLHKFSERKNGPFVKINCGMIPENLLESEFFGYESGAFTGAKKGGKKGKIEMADGGTLFFDEIGEMPLSLQAKLLEFLQDREIVRVGGMNRIPVNVRVVSATNRNLREMVSEGTFRGDLYYRLDVVPIHLKPLRERSDDILPLTKLFLEKYNVRYKTHKSLSPAVKSYFLSYPWPGNVRELMHTVERLLIISDSDIIGMDAVKKVLMEVERDMIRGDLSDTGEFRTKSFSDEIEDLLDSGVSLKEAKGNLELKMVQYAYEKYQSTYKVADALGISQPAIIKILQRHGYRIHNGQLMKK